jgi:hypothetical protein
MVAAVFRRLRRVAMKSEAVVLLVVLFSPNFFLPLDAMLKMLSLPPSVAAFH